MMALSMFMFSLQSQEHKKGDFFPSNLNNETVKRLFCRISRNYDLVNQYQRKLFAFSEFFSVDDGQ